ncbi:hypothetical protein SKAU_G00110040 [Synaphobranchus kaupii]|uniref:Uncharacterized protein n=1 Tax=Synaphobranchus kaupii TaxID=118154 RepID=A0A9Q1G0A7_SYNKA|nr:hypothetical protein SKAU_G00110040 [Synaphobranchus kaupii]
MPWAHPWGCGQERGGGGTDAPFRLRNRSEPSLELTGAALQGGSDRRMNDAGVCLAVELGALPPAMGVAPSPACQGPPPVRPCCTRDTVNVVMDTACYGRSTAAQVSAWSLVWLEQGWNSQCLIPARKLITAHIDTLPALLKRCSGE